MKKKNWLLILLIIVFLLAFAGYRDYNAQREDTQRPVLTIDDGEMLQVSVKDSKKMMLQGVTAMDAQDGDVSKTLVVESIRLIDEDGTLEVSYAAADHSGNVAKASRQIRYTDYESPRFGLNQPLVYTYGQSFDIMQNVIARDVLDGDVQHRIRATALSDKAISELGTHHVYFQVTNSLGDTSEIILPVEVQPPNSFDAYLTLSAYMIHIPQGSVFQPEKYLKEFRHRDVEFTFENGMPRDLSLKTTGQVMTQTPGVYTVEYRVTYTIRHETNPDYDQRYTGYSKMIVVVEG